MGTKNNKTLKNKKEFIEKQIMPLARVVNEHRFKTFLMIYSVWLIDLATTIIALGFFSDSLVEANPLAASFFKGGIIGWFMWAVFCAAMIAFLIYLPDIFMKIGLLLRGKTSKEKINKIKNHYHLLRLYSVIMVVVSESFVIFNNTKLLMWNLF